MAPSDRVMGVPRGTNIKITFSEEMDPATINSNTVKLTMNYYVYNYEEDLYYYARQRVSATISKDPTDPSGRTWVVDPSILLPAARRYELEVGPGVRDLDDEAYMSVYKRTYFTTASW